MAIILNDNIRVNAGKPVNAKYLSTGNTAYTSVAAVNAAITLPERHIGLTVLMYMSGMNIEYWYKEGVADGNLVEKKYDSEIPSGDFVTGATNLGYFSGKTGVQVLPIDHLTDDSYDGQYSSLYNYYYRGSEGAIHIGIPNDGISRRGYVRPPTIPSPVYKSWIWNQYTGGTGSGNRVGWVLIDGNINDLLDSQFHAGVGYYNGASDQHTETGYTQGVAYPSLSNVQINLVLGNLTSGNTLTIGARPFAYFEHNNLHFRTVVSDTPQFITVKDDESFIRISGATSVLQGANVGSGAAVFKQRTGITMQFRTIIGTGATTVSTLGDTIVINSIGGSGGTGTYNLSSPAAITVGGISGGTVLTGKTSFQLFEELLVPVQYPTLTAPFVTTTLSNTGCFEVGTVILPSLNITSTYNAGCIDPQYTATSDCRSNGVIGYCFTSIGGQVDGYYVTGATTLMKPISSYSVSAATQTWGTCACRCAGVQPYNSKGLPYQSGLTAGFTTPSSASLTGCYPYYYGKLTSGSRPVPNNTLITTGCMAKSIAQNSNNTVTVTFNSNASEYTWLAIPQTSSSKYCWYIDDLSKGIMNTNPTDKYPDEQIVSVTSAQACWSGINYKVYMSKAIGEIATIQFRNS